MNLKSGVEMKELDRREFIKTMAIGGAVLGL